ncbi:MAG: ferrous iron transport protein B, partial [Clostridiales bacterium]|nr:ferrous iron transport protein B [Clostridiales bacterium]
MKSETTQWAKTLGQLQPGQSAVIKRIENERGPVKRRLVDMGLTPGTLVTVRKVAPLGDPIEINLRGYELSLRKEDAGRIALCPPGETPVQRPHVHEKSGMVQHVPDSETLRRMWAGELHERTVHGAGRGYRGRHGGQCREIKLALAGNPNSGKTTLFNTLTGSNQYVGNWPGVTVEKKEGRTKVGGRPVTVVDLPGIYSLSPYSMEEVVARRFIVEEE